MIEADARRLSDSRSLPVMAERLISRRTVLRVLGASALVHAAGAGTSSLASQPSAGPAEPLHYLTLREIARRIEIRELSAVDLTEKMLDRIATVDRSLKSYATVMRDEALAAARAANREIRAGKYRGPPRSAEFTMPMDLAGVPAICVRCGFSADGLPYSIQFTGRRLSESTLCRIGHAYEQATEWHTHHPNVKTG